MSDYDIIEIDVLGLTLEFVLITPDNECFVSKKYNWRESIGEYVEGIIDPTYRGTHMSRSEPYDVQLGKPADYPDVVGILADYILEPDEEDDDILGFMLASQYYEQRPKNSSVRVAVIRDIPIPHTLLNFLSNGVSAWERKVATKMDEFHKDLFDPRSS